MEQKSSSCSINESHLAELLMLRKFKKVFEAKKFKEIACSPIKFKDRSEFSGLIPKDIYSGNNLFSYHRIIYLIYILYSFKKL